MKSKLLCIVLIMLLLVAFPANASAEEQVNILITATPDSLLQAGEVTLTISISFVSATQAPIGDVALYDPASNTRLMSWNNVHSQQTLVDVIPGVYVSADKLGKTVPLVLRYSIGGIERFVQTGYTVLSGVPGTGDSVQVQFTRTADREIAMEGTSITLMYWVGNSGLTNITDITVADELGGQIGTRNILVPGDSVAFYSTLIVRETVFSAPKLTYTNAATGETTAMTLEPLALSIATPKLTATLKADVAEINAGDPVIFTYTVANEGNVSFFDIQLSDVSLGMIPGGGKELLPGGVYVYTRQENLVKSADFSFVVSAQDGLGNSTQATSNSVSITVLNEAIQTAPSSDALKITAVPRLTKLTEPGQAAFQLTVSNQGDEPILDVVVSESSGGQIFTLERLNGDKGSEYTVDVTKTTDFTFIVTGRLASGAKLQAVTQPITIEVGSSDPQQGGLDWLSPSPEPTAEPLPSTTPALSDGEGGASGRSFLLGAIAVIGVLITLCVVALVLLMIREQRRRRMLAESEYEYAQYAEGDEGDAKDEENRGDGEA